MDWDADFLKAMTIECDFRRNNKTVCVMIPNEHEDSRLICGWQVFLATTWAGFIGVLTAVKPGPVFCSCGPTIDSNSHLLV